MTCGFQRKKLRCGQMQLGTKSSVVLPSAVRLVRTNILGSSFSGSNGRPPHLVSSPLVFKPLLECGLIGASGSLINRADVVSPWGVCLYKSVVTWVRFVCESPPLKGVCLHVCCLLAELVVGRALTETRDVG
eukprot:4785567-Amphidinium_carterae.4